MTSIEKPEETKSRIDILYWKRIIKFSLKTTLVAGAVGTGVYLAYKHYTEHKKIHIGGILNMSWGPYPLYILHEQTVSNIYKDILFRTAADSEIDYWVGKIKDKSIWKVMNDIINNYEPYIKNCFMKFGGRLPSQDEMHRYKFVFKHNTLDATGISIKQYLDTIKLNADITVTLYGFPTNVYKTAYTNKLSKEEFVKECYKIVYGREIKDYELQHYHNSMSKMARDKIFIDIASNSERYTFLLYQKFLPYKGIPGQAEFKIINNMIKKIISNMKKKVGRPKGIYEQVYPKFRNDHCLIKLYDTTHFSDSNKSISFTTKSGKTGLMKLKPGLEGQVSSIRIPYKIFKYVTFYNIQNQVIYTTKKGVSLPNIHNTFGKNINYVRYARLND